MAKGRHADHRPQGPRGHAQSGRALRAPAPRDCGRRLGQPGGAGAGPRPGTQAFPDRARTIIAHNDSPDIPFDSSINPYRGCEHGCVYCYARPSHAHLGLSAGLDFETKIFVKHEAAALLRQELARPGYVCSPISLGANTDPYQPLERRLRITRQVLEVLAETRHPVGIVTKSALVTRDIDLLAPMARAGPGTGLRLGHHARRRDRPHAGAARRGPAPAARRDPRPGGGRA